MSSPESNLHKVDVKEGASGPAVAPETQEAVAQPEEQPATTTEADASKRQESREQEKVLRAKAGVVADSLQIFATQISLRERNGMDTFMSSATRSNLEENVGALRAAASSEGPIDQAHINQMMTGIADAFAEFKNQNASGQVRENPKSLMNVAESLKRLYQGVKAFKETGGNPESEAAVNTLLAQIEKKHQFMGALYKSAQAYLA